MPKRREFDIQRFAVRVEALQGILSLSDLDDTGVPRSTAYHRCRPGGPWQLVLPGVMATFSGPLVPTHRVAAALRYAGDEAVVTGVASLRLRNLRNLPDDDQVHVLVDQGKHRLSSGFVIIERTKRLPHSERILGIPCAPVARAVIDAARRMRNPEQVRALVSEAVQRRYCTVQELAEVIKVAQRRGTALPRRVIREVADGVRSIAESEAREIILRAGLPDPLRNHDVYDKHGRWLARPDAIWPELGLVLEIDSLEWHLSPAAYQRTQARQRLLAAHGLRVLPVTPGWLRSNPREFLQELHAAIEESKGRPAPEITVRPPKQAA